MNKRILFFLKNYKDYSEIFAEYSKIFNKNNFEIRVFDLTAAYSQGGKLNYIISVLREIKNFKPDFVYIGDEFFSKNVLSVAFFRKFFFHKYKTLALIATQYIPKNKDAFLNKIKLNFLLRNIDILFCRNKKELVKIKEIDLFKNYQGLRQIYLGVPEKFFHKINQPKNTIWDFLLRPKSNYFNIKDKYILGFVGRIAPEKGLDILLECLIKLPYNFILLIAGKTDNLDYQKKTQDFIKENNLEERIVWFNDVKEEELKYIYNACDLIVIPTTKKFNNFLELFGSVIAESMLCQTLIAGSDNGSIPEVIGKPEMIFKENDPEDLLRVINYIYNLKPEEKRKIIADNYKRASKEYSAEAFVNTIIKAISK